ncbi:hypothetical protein JCM19992_32400 [Thermostilla marina]
MRRAIHILVVVSVVATVSRMGLAQENPFGVPQGEPAGPRTEAREEVELPPPPEPEDPAVAALLATNPSTPLEKLRAAIVLVDLGAVDKAKTFVDDLLGADLDDATLVSLADQIGASKLYALAADRDLAPSGRELSLAIFAAVERRNRDPQRIARLIDELKTAEGDALWFAVDGLRQAGQAAVGPLVEQLVDPTQAAHTARIRQALAALGSNAAGPLGALLDADDPEIRRHAILALAALGERETIYDLLSVRMDPETSQEIRELAEAAVLKLMGRLPSPNESIRLLAAKATAALQPPTAFGPDDPTEVDYALWNDQANKLEILKIDREEARRRRAARFAAAALRGQEDDPALRCLYAQAALEDEAFRFGIDRLMWEWDPQLAAVVEDFTTGELSLVLERCLDEELVAASMGAVRVLEHRGDLSVLYERKESVSPLVDAMRFGDRRVRFAAMQAALKLNAGSPFPGAGYVSDSLVYFASTTGKRRAIVAGPSVADSMRIAGHLEREGFDVVTVAAGREVLRAVSSSPDFELIFLSASIQGPSLSLMLDPLRQIQGTARIPVGIFATADQLDRARKLAERDRWVLAFARPHDQESVQEQTSRLLALPDRDYLSRDERIRQAQTALDWIRALYERPSPAYPSLDVEGVGLHALTVAELQDRGTAILALVGTHRAQKALVDFAGRVSLPLPLRVAAVDAFRRNVEQHGVMLTTDEIMLQYDRYNASETMDPGTQKVFSLILDIIEAPMKIRQMQTATGRPET